MTVIRALSSLPAPSGGAVRLTVHATSEDVYVLVLASAHPELPDPIIQAGARKVFGGKLRHRLPGRAGLHAFMLLDLNSDALRDGEQVYYHVFELHPDGRYGEGLTVGATPRCARRAVVTIARDVVTQRLRYHLRRAVDEGVVLTDGRSIPVLEQELRAEGQPLPAVFVKERVSPNPTSNTVGNHAGEYVDAHHPAGVKEYRFEYRASVDLLLLCNTPDERTDLEAFLRGALDADRELFVYAGLEAPNLSAFTRHDVDEAAGADVYGSELSVEAGITTRVFEEITQARPHTVSR